MNRSAKRVGRGVMKATLICAVLVLGSIRVAAAGDYNDVDIGTSPTTKLEGRFKVGTIRVTITTKPSTLPGRKAWDRSVSKLRVFVGRRELFVPRSAYLDVSNVNRARLREEGKSIVL